MATINLGAIKFNWKGAYNSSTSYAVDDVVSSGGNSYVCIQAHSNQAVGNATAYWNIMSSAGTNGTNGTDLTSTLTTQGDILYRDGSGLAKLGAGTSGQVLQTGGSGANPSWTNVSSDFVRLGFGSSGMTSSISIDFFTTDYDIYKVFVTGLNGSSPGVESALRFNSSAGNAVTGSNYRGIFTGGYRNNSGGTSAGQQISDWDDTKMSLSNVSNQDYEQGNHEITIFRPMNASVRTKIIVSGGGYENNHMYSRHGQGYYNSTQAHTGLTFLATSGNIAIEHMEVYGIK